MRDGNPMKLDKDRNRERDQKSCKCAKRGRKKATTTQIAPAPASASIFNVFVIFSQRRMRRIHNLPHHSKYDACYNLIYTKRNEHKSSGWNWRDERMNALIQSMLSGMCEWHHKFSNA